MSPQIDKLTVNTDILNQVYSDILNKEDGCFTQDEWDIFFTDFEIATKGDFALRNIVERQTSDIQKWSEALKFLEPIVASLKPQGKDLDDGSDEDDDLIDFDDLEATDSKQTKEIFDLLLKLGPKISASKMTVEYNSYLKFTYGIEYDAVPRTSVGRAYNSLKKNGYIVKDGAVKGPYGKKEGLYTLTKRVWEGLTPIKSKTVMEKTLDFKREVEQKLILVNGKAEIKTKFFNQINSLFLEAVNSDAKTGRWKKLNDYLQSLDQKLIEFSTKKGA